MLSSGLAIVSTGASLLSGIFNAQAQRQEARATVNALKKEKDFNLGVLRQQKIDQYWSDAMSLWRSGMSTGTGTSAAAVIGSNQRVLERNIDFQASQYDTQIANAKAAAGRRFLGIF